MVRPARLATLALALAGSTGFAAIATVGPARGAENDLIVVASAHYEVRPAENRVRVTVDLSATNTVPDTAEGRTYFSGITLPIHPAATAISASGEEIGLGVAVAEATQDYTAVSIQFGRGVFYSETYRFTLTFEIVDNGGVPERETRIRPSFIAFPVWAFGTHGGAAVEVVVPGGYEVALLAGEMDQQSSGSATVVSATAIADPQGFFAYLTAELPNAQREEHLTVTVGQKTAVITLLGWPDDPDWSAHMRDILTKGLPALGEAIGLDYPIQGNLRVRENAYGRLGNYAGYFIDELDAIEVRFDVDPYVGLHESAHIWFNASLIRGRWIGEAFASFYAEEAARRAGFEIQPFTLDAELRRHAFPLNAWGEPGAEDINREDYAYAAAVEVARRIAAIAAQDGLREVWGAADRKEPAYLPIGRSDPETGVAVGEGWQRLLDLLEERTDGDYDPIWREWIVTPSEAPLLIERDRTRKSYAQTVEMAGDWRLPRALRILMGSWRFEDAQAELNTAQAVLRRRDAIAHQAAELGLAPPDRVRVAFEGTSLRAAGDEALQELDALEAIGAASATLTQDLLPVEAIGLILEPEPQAHLEAARRAYEAGEQSDAVEEATAATAARVAAAERGRHRAAMAGGAILALDALAMGTLVVVRRRRAADVQPTA